MRADPIRYYERGDPELKEEAVLGESFIRWAYQSPAAGLLSGLAFRWCLPSALLGAWFNSRLSKGKIRKTIAELAIDETEFLDRTSSYGSFNEFFTRRLKPEARPVATDPEVVISPADGRVLVFPKMDGADAVPVKGARYGIDELLGRPAPEFHGGALAVIRLCPADYHRFHFPADGTVSESQRLPGKYHSVNPIALAMGLRIFTENKRAWSILQTEAFGRIAIIEVGAFGVGAIEWTWDGNAVAKMDERGYFTFGGSTQILVFEPGRIAFSEDLVQHSANGIETLLRVGQPLATASGG